MKRRRLGLAALAAALAAGAAASASDPGAARAAASQDWPPFVLVAGLLLVGLVAECDGLFQASGRLLARSGSPAKSWMGAVLLIASVTALLNLDTSVAFLTPVLVYSARAREDPHLQRSALLSSQAPGGNGHGLHLAVALEAPMLYGCILLSNAASLVLPGSNLTNLIVLGHLHLSGGEFAARMAPAWSVAVLLTALVVTAMSRASFSRSARPATEAKPRGPKPLVGAVAVCAVAGLVLGLGSPALAVLGVGALAVTWRIAAGGTSFEETHRALGPELLLGLFAVAVTLGVVGRDWDGPAHLLARCSSWETAAVASLASVAVNNLPAASLLGARIPPHPFALLVGLDLGPNLFFTGSLSWVLWFRSARMCGARPSLRKATLLGIVAAPLSIAAALAVLGPGTAR